MTLSPTYRIVPDGGISFDGVWSDDGQWFGTADTRSSHWATIVKVAVINLARRADRRDTFLRWNRHHPLPFEFFPAVDGQRIQRSDLTARGLLAPGEQGFNAGALGNALSHWTLWQACAAGREPYLIFEDDACLRGDFWKHAKPALEHYLSAHDMISFGFNTDSVIALRGSDGVVSAMRFDETIKRRAGYFDDYAKLQDVRPNLFRCHQFWGILAYGISPAGARTLIDACFPLSSREPVELIGERRSIRPYGLDSMINLALQKARLSVVACYPALALGPNSHADSDIQQVACSG